MSKSNRIVAFLASFILLFNCTSGGIKELAVFAEDEIMPILSELNSSNFEDNINNDSQNNNHTDEDESVEKSTEESIDESIEQSDEKSTSQEIPDNTLPHDDSSATDDVEQIPVDTSIDVNLSNSTGKQFNDVYYVGPNSGNSKRILFEFDIKNVTSIEAKNTNDNTFKLEDDSVQKDDTHKTLAFSIKEENKVHQTTIVFKNDYGETKEIQLKFEYDSKNPEIKFAKDSDGNELSEDFDKNGVYYMDSKLNELELFVKDSSFNNPIKTGKITLNGNSVSNISSQPNDTYKITLNNILENKVNLLEVELIDFVGNKTTETFKFFKDTAEAKVNVLDSDGLRLYDEDENNKIYYLDKGYKDLSVNLEFENVDNLNEFSTNNILVNDQQLPVYSEDLDKDELSIQLSDIENNKATLILRNIKDNQIYEITFNNIKDNDKDTLEYSYNFCKDTIAPDIELSLDSDNAKKISVQENNTLYLNYKEYSINLSFDFKDEKYREHVTYKYDLSDNTVSSDHNNSNNITLEFDKSSKNVQSKELTVTICDWSNNKTVLKYNIIHDPTDYSNYNFKDLVTTTLNDKEFGNNNIAYVYDEDESEEDESKIEEGIVYFQFKYNTEFIDKNNFEIYKKLSANSEIQITSSNDNYDLCDEATIRTSSEGLNATYVLRAKNGSLNKENSFTVYYSTKKDLDINFIHNDEEERIIKDRVYTDNNNKFKFAVKITDKLAKETDKSKIIAKVKYTSPNGFTKYRYLKLNSDSEYIEIFDDKVWCDENIEDVITYTLKREAILDSLNFNEFKDGTYQIDVSAESYFGYTREKSISFIIDSFAPQGTLVFKDNNSGDFKAVNTKSQTEDGHLFINPAKVYIGLKLEDLKSSDKYNNRTIEIKYDNKSFVIPFNELKETTLDNSTKYDATKTYMLFDIQQDKLKDIMESYNNEYKNYNVNITVFDHVENGANTNEYNNAKYTIDINSPELKVTAKGLDGLNNLALFNKNSVINKDDAPFISLEDLKAIITNESNNTIENTKANISSNILWLFRSSEQSHSTELSMNKLVSNDGFYEFVITSTDKAGNSTTKKIALNVDRTAPMIDMGSMSDNEALSNPMSLSVDIFKTFIGKYFTKNMNVRDNSNNSMEFKLELSDSTANNKYMLTANSTNPSFNTKDVADGVYDAVLRAKDRAGNESKSTGKITFDGKSPNVTVSATSLQDNDFAIGSHTVQHKNISSVTPVITVQDITTKPEDITVNIKTKFNNNKSYSGSTLSPVVNGYNTTLTIPSVSAEDIYDLEVIVKDRIVNERPNERKPSVTNINFGIDRNMPTLSVTAGGKNITEGSTTYLNASDTKDLVATVNDNISSADEITTKIDINGSSYQSSKYNFTSDNTYNVTVSAVDKTNDIQNTNTMSFTIIVDTVIPKLTIEDVIEGTFYNKDVLPKITTDDETAIETITLNGKNYVKGTAINSDNSYELIAKAEDEAGNIGEASVNFVLDKTMPTITIKNIENNEFYDKGELIPEIIVEDNDPEVETVMFLDNEEYLGGKITNDGSHMLYVKAVDRASNTTEARVQFKTNFNPPIITINGIENNQVFDGPVTLDIEFQDAVESSIFVNKEEHYNGDTISTPGDYTLVVKAVDEFGSESEEQVSFTISKNVISPESHEDNSLTANTYKLIAIISIFTFSMALTSSYFIYNRSKNRGI